MSDKYDKARARFKAETNYREVKLPEQRCDTCCRKNWIHSRIPFATCREAKDNFDGACIIADRHDAVCDRWKGAKP